MPVTIEKARLNIWNIGSILLGIGVTAFGWGVTYSAMMSANADNQKQVEFVRSEIKDIKAQLPAITQLQFQMTNTSQLASENKKAIEATNERIGRVVDSFGGKLDTVIDRLNIVASDVKVLTVQNKDRAQPTSFKMGN